jgi:starch synthase (maltosyl-transferring)
MVKSNGKKRVIITNVYPAVEFGKYTAKAVVGDEILFSASVFGDGHDLISASLYLKEAGKETPVELPMKFLTNDHWEVPYIFPQVGRFEFWVEGWEDHFKNWKHGLLKKFEAGQDLQVELQIGILLLEKAAVALASESATILKWIERIKNAEDVAAAVTAAEHEDLESLLYKYRPDDIISRSEPLQIEIERKKAGYSTWYELFPRSSSSEPGKHGTFNDVVKLLPRVAQMGFDVLYFPPIHPIGEKNRKGKNNSLEPVAGDPGSPWAIGNRKGGHKTIHPELGTLRDFRKLVEAATSYDIEIAMDIAFQCAPDHPYVKEHPQWFNWRPDGTVQYAENPPKRYEDILPFNFETDDWENLWAELKSVIDFWIDNGIRIFRIDNPHTKAFKFWEWTITEVRNQHPEVLFLAEAFTRPRIMERLAKVGFNQSYTYFTWRNTKKEIEEYMEELTKTGMRYYFRPNFWPNTPDILPPALIHGGENAHIMRLILAGTLSSNYGLYGPVYEFGLNEPHGKKEEYVDNEKYEIHHWDWDKYSRIKEIIIRLNKIRKDNTALQSTWNIEFAETNNDQIICYTKVDQQTGNRLIVVVNLDVHHTQSANVRLPIPELNLTYDSGFRVRDLLSGHIYNWQGEWQYVELNPYQMPAHIFRIEP